MYDRGVAIGFEAHDIVHLVEKGGAGGFGAVLVADGIARMGGLGFGRGVAVFLQVQGFFADARDGGEEAQVNGGVGLGIGNGQFGEKFAHADGGELEAQFLEFVGLAVLGEIEGEIEPGGEDIEAVLLPEPILVAAGIPVGDVAGRNLTGQRGIGGLLEFKDDLVVGGAVGEAVVD